MMTSHQSSIPVDDEIADGLGEEVNGVDTKRTLEERKASSSSDYDGFIPSRDRSRTHSILPSSAFLAPKRPPQSRSPLPLSPSDSPLFISSFEDTVSNARLGRGEPIPMDYTGRERGRLNHLGSTLTQTDSSYEKPDSSSLDVQAGRNRSKSSSKLDQSAAESYYQGEIRGKPSQDLLLSRTEEEKIQNENVGCKRPSLHWGSSKQRQSMRRKYVLPEKQQREDVKKLRKYKNHQGSNRFFLFGLIMTSDDNPFPFIASLVYMFALPILWFIFVAPFTWHHISPAPVIIFAYIWAVGASSMCVTAWRDPGVLPRDLDPDPPCTAGEDGNAIGIDDPLAVPLPRIIRVRNGTDLKVKWCDTCGTYRPPRSSHCRVCDNCVESIDHHCTFLNTCIGRRNYFSFFAFLLATILACYMSIVSSILHIYYLTRSTTNALPGGGFGQDKNFRQALSSTPLSAVIFILSIMAVFPLMTLFGYHIRLICMNRTTVEQIRINATSTYSEKPTYEDIDSEKSNPTSCLSINMGKIGKDPNPFAHQTTFRNIKTVLLRPMMAHSWIDRYHYQHLDHRRINPAFTSSINSKTT